MSTNEIELRWNGTDFESSIKGKEIYLSEVSADNRAITNPKQLMLVSLAGCTAFDVESLLKKMRQSYEAFSIHVRAELSEEHPRVYTTVHLVYALKGTLDADKVVRAVELSQTKYCGVSEMFRQFAKLTYEIRINGEEILSK